MEVFNGQVTRKPEEAKSVFIINDIALQVPPTHISIRKEDMVWQWKTLRTNASTKIPSGRGVVQVSVRLIFVPNDFIVMHRLIVELKHSPFCFIENALIRESIVPDWLHTQMMAFTMTGLNVQNLTGSPGTFIVDLDLRWFNYAPYAINWLYRDEYATKPIGPDQIVKTIATFGPGLKKQTTIIDFEGRDVSNIDSYEIISTTKDIVGGFTMNDILFNHAGTAFDLLPRPTDVMQKAKPVVPHLSNIYKRYINSLQQQSLYHNFNVDIAQMIKDEEMNPEIQRVLALNSTVEPTPAGVAPEEVSGAEIKESYQGSTWKMFTSGHVIGNQNGGYNRVEALHSEMLPASVKSKVIARCLSYCRYVNFYWHQYIVDENDLSIKRKISKTIQDTYDKTASTFLARAQLLDKIVNNMVGMQDTSAYTGAVNLKSIADVQLTSASNISSDERITYRIDDLKRKYLALIPTIEEAKKEYENGSPYLFHPVIQSVSNFSGFGMRKLPHEDAARAHNGIDLQSTESTLMYAPFDGELIVKSIYPYNTFSNQNFNYFVNEDLGLDNKNFLRANNLFTSSGAGGTSVEIISSEFPGYSAYFAHMVDIGTEGTINNQQVVKFYKDRNEQEYGGATILVEKVKVFRGDIIGRYGNTGGSSGAHLHLTIKKDGVPYDPLPFLIAKDVSNLNEDDLQAAGIDDNGLPLVLDERLGTSSTSPEDNYLTSPSGVLTPEANNNKSTELSDQERQAWEGKEYNYLAEGFLPYEDMKDVTNVRKRTVKFSFGSSNNNFFPGIVPDFLNRENIDLPQENYENDSTHIFSLKSSDNIVITNVVGSLNHVVASIPLLGHEFPTHQHLGSIEPSYTIELVTQADSLFSDNLSAEGSLLEYMRSTLQKNARDFRVIPDSYSVATDHFITRLLGTFRDDDLSFYSDERGLTEVEELKKRSLINRVSTETVEGHPGLSTIQLSLVETNPYVSEDLNIESNSNEDERDALIKEVLHRLYNMNLSSSGKIQKIVEEYSSDIYTEEENIKEVLEKAGLSPQSFGKTTWSEITELVAIKATRDNNLFTFLFSSQDTINRSLETKDQEAWQILAELQEQASEENFALYGDYHKKIYSAKDAMSFVPMDDRESGEVTFFYNMSDFYTVYPELKPSSDNAIQSNQLDLTAKHTVLKEILRSASISLAESDIGLADNLVSESLYNLPVQPEMMSAFLYWLRKYMDKIAEGGSATDNSSDIANAINIEEKDISAILNKITWNINEIQLTAENKALIDNKYELLEQSADVLGSAGTEALELYFGADTGNVTTSDSELLEDFKNAVQDLADKYFENFIKININSESLSLLEQTWKDISGFIQDTLSTFTGKGTSEVKFDAYTTTKNQISYLLQWFFSPDTLRQVDAEGLALLYQMFKAIRGAFNIFNLTLSVLTLILGGLALLEPSAAGEAAVGGGVVAAVTVRKAIGEFAKKVAVKLATPAVQSGGSAIAGAVGAGTYILGRSSEEVSVADSESAAYQLLKKKVAAPNYSIFINKETESQKVSFFRKKLIEMAETIISNPSLLTALGIRTENYSLKPFLNEWVGTECYPDLQLPEHPYYVGTHSYAMSPDFYMWNTYEDGGAQIKDEVKRVVEKGVETVVKNSYNFMKRMQDKGLQAVKDGGMQVNNGMQDTLPKIQSLGMLPEGSNTSKVMNPGVKVVKSGPNSPITLVKEDGSPVWDTFDASVNAFKADPLKEIEAWNKLVSKADGELRNNTFTNLDGGSEYIKNDKKNTGSAWYAATSELRPIIALNNQDGNPQYVDTSTPLEAYESYLNKVKTMNEMFGSRQGYLGEVLNKKNAAEIVSEVGDTLLSSLSESENWYTKEGIQQVVKHSAADIISEKVTIKRAYPTFKLYFVEEDEEESRWLNLDDFYSFNAVKEFNFYQSRKEASSTATIVLQNVSGTLDGTRRSAIVDLDYFNRKQADSIQKKNPDIEVLGSNKQHVSSKDQPFDAIVLRPGMNVQLRVGYSNDPNMLHVLLNGRVVDVQWNMTGDLTELTVQSFGTELTSTKKGIGGNDYSINWDERVYYTTHQLLGSLMMDRDLRHFGRWEFGRLTQIGEDKNADLDFYPYQDEGFLGGHPITKWTYETFTNHPFMIGLLIGGIGAFIASKGKISLFATKPAGSFFSKFPFLGNLALRTGRIAALGGDDIAKAAKGITNSSQATQVWGALGSKTGKSLDEAIKALGITDTAMLSNIDKLKAALNGLSGGVRVRQVNLLQNINPQVAGTLLSSEAEALARWQSASKWLYYPRFGFQDLKTWTGIQNNLWSIGSLTIGNGLIRSLSNTLVVGSSITTGVFLGENALQAVNYFGLPEIYKNIKKRTKRINARLKMSPADDNIFCPSPASYMTLRKIRDMSRSKKWGIILNGFIKETVSVDLANTYKEIKSVLSPEEIDPEIFEKRVLPPSCQYRIHASTIWEVFEEMTLRHPGWIWGTRPYGTEFRDTMFFGTPSQRYWSRPAEPSFVLRMNKLHEYIKRTGETEAVLKKQITEVYGSTISDKMFEEGNQAFLAQAHGTLTGSLEANEGISSSLELIKDKFRTAIMDEWLKGMEQRFEPFRRYHLLTSETDIISNNIISSEHSVQNGAQVVYQKMDALGKLVEEREILQMKAHSLIPDDMVNTAVVDKHNCISYKMALRYGQGAMIYGMKEMYRGEISILGNPRIRPWDVCIISDSYNDISGPVEVESVVHMFSHETGFITEIKPNALVIGNEISTFPVLEALKIYAMARADLNNRDISIDGSSEPTNATNQAMNKYFEKRYSEIFDNSSEAYIAEINKTIEESRLLQNLGMTVMPETLSKYPTIAGSWSVGKGIAGAATIALGAIVAGTGASKIPQLVFKGSNAARAATIATTAVVGGASTAMLSPLTPNGKSVVNSAASYIGSKLLFAKCMEQDTIMIIPLIKGKRPIVSGMTMKNPSEVFESILGSVSNVMEDTIVGTRDMFESWLDYKSASWMQVDDLVNERSNFLRRWHTGAQIFYNWEEEVGVSE